MSLSDRDFLRKNGFDIAAYDQIFSRASIEDLLDLVEKRIFEAIDALETDANVISQLDEDGFSAFFCRAISNGNPLLATQQQNSRGHVDITITAPLSKELMSLNI